MSPPPDITMQLLDALRAADISDEAVERFLDVAAWLFNYPDLQPWRAGPKRVELRKARGEGAARVWIVWMDDPNTYIHMHSHLELPLYISYTLRCRTSSVSAHVPEPRSPYGPNPTLSMVFEEMGQQMRESGVTGEEFRQMYRDVRGYGEEE